MKRVVSIIAILLGLMFVASGVYVSVIRPWHLSWGTQDGEANETLPGDEIVPQPVHQYTRAITIDAPPETVWPWLAQIGQGRGGFYSYDWLENLLGFDIHSADRIIPELQHIQIGDQVRLNREGSMPPPFTVARIDPNSALVLSGGDTYSWAFILKPVGAHGTRLIARARAYTEPSWLAPLMYTEPITFIMEQKMLRRIKERAERA